MKKILVLRILSFLFTIVFFVSCSQEQKDKKVSSYDVQKTTNNESEEVINTAYKIPSPVELYMFLKNNELSFNKDALNSVENIAKYYTNASKAINFGIYASDLAYCTVFGMHQETFLYFSTTRTLATDLGFTNGFDELMVNRLNANLYNNDSLFQITNDSYADACNFLEESNRKDILALILAGSWIESMYIAMQFVENFESEDPIVIRFAEQRYLLDNLIEYYRSIDNNISTDKILDKLFDLQATFDLLYDNPEETIITKTQYEAIAEKIDVIRKELIS